MQRIGVFVCWCGSNIAATVDVETVSQALAKEPGVVFSTNYQYMCSQTGQQMIQEKIHEYGLTGVVICSCSPRMHEQTFRKTCEKAGLNPYMVEIANIREQCSWIHKDKEAGTEKAIILGRAAIAKVHLNAPLTAGSSPVTKRALVIGGGIAGIQTALDIAEAGYPVDIVEKTPSIGGRMSQMIVVRIPHCIKISIYFQLFYLILPYTEGFFNNFQCLTKRLPNNLLFHENKLAIFTSISAVF